MNKALVGTLIVASLATGALVGRTTADASTDPAVLLGHFSLSTDVRPDGGIELAGMACGYYLEADAGRTQVPCWVVDLKGPAADVLRLSMERQRK